MDLLCIKYIVWHICCDAANKREGGGKILSNTRNGCFFSVLSICLVA